MRYDLLIKGGWLIDSAIDLDGRADIAVSNGKIVEIAPKLPEAAADAVIDADELIVAPAFIDFHAHAMFLGGIGLGSDLDPVCRASGVTTLVDGGSSGAANFPCLKECLIDSAATRIRLFLHISSIGLADLAVGESSYLNLHDADRAAATAKAHPEVIVGIKVREQAEVVGENGLKPLRLAKKAAALAGNLPVMVHVTNPPVPLHQILELLDPGDVVSHFLHGRGLGILDDKGRIHPAVYKARQRGILFDVGHGRHHVDFRVARIAIREGFLPDTISTDLTRGGMAGIVKDLPHTLSKFLNLGMSLEDVLAGVTTHPARFLGMEGTLGTLQQGALAEIAVFKLETGAFTFQDTEGNTMTGKYRIAPRYTIQGGKITWEHKPSFGS